MLIFDSQYAFIEGMEEKKDLVNDMEQAFHKVAKSNAVMQD